MGRDCGASVLNSSEVLIRAHQEKIQGLIGDVWHMSTRGVQQLSLSAPSFNKDYTHWGLEHRALVLFSFFLFCNFPGITCLVGVPRAPGSFLDVFHLLDLEPNPDPTQLGWHLAFCLAHCQRLPSELG